jgi:heptosyltransferase I
MPGRLPQLRPDSTARIVIVMMSAVGDAIHVLPVVTALKRHAPGVHVTWILQGAPAALVAGHPAVDEIVRFDPRGGTRAYRALGRELRRRGPFDLCLALQVYFKANLATALVPARVKLGFDRARARDANWLFTTHRIPPRARQHVQDQYFEFLDALGVPHEPVTWDLGPWPHERAAQRAWLADVARPPLALTLASSTPDRDWPVDRMAALSDAIVERHGLQPVLVGGRSERELAAEAAFRAAARHQPLSTLGASFRDMIGIIDASALLVTPNTAPMHVAVTVGTPVLSLHGALDPNRTGPYHRYRDLVLDAYHEPDDPPGAVLQARRAGHRVARLTVDDALAKVDVWAARYRDAALAKVAAIRAGERLPADG